MNYLHHSKYGFFFRTLYSQIKTFNLNRNLKGPNLVFIWIPKTGGTTIYNILLGGLGMQKRVKINSLLSFPNRGPVTFGHVSYLSLLEIGIINNNYNSSAYKFCFVRNPYNRIISLFNYLKQKKEIDQKIEFEKFLDLVHLKTPPIGIHNTSGISQANTQCSWIFGKDNELIVDDIFRIEEINYFFEFISKKYLIKLEAGIPMRVSKKEISFETISNNTAIIEKIENIYSRDFEFLGYEKVSKKI